MSEPVDTKGVTKYRIVLLNYGSDLDLVSIDGESRIQDADDYDVVLAKDHDRALTAAQQRANEQYDRAQKVSEHNSRLWSQNEALNQRIADLEAQCARVQRDADRYAWLRDEDNGWIVEPRDPPIHGPDTFNLDAAIDAAMAAKGDDWLTREARQIGLHSPACASFGQNECDCGAKP